MATVYLLAKVGENQNPTFSAKLEANLEKCFPKKWRDIGVGSYLVACEEPTVTKDLSEKLEISGGSVGAYIVTKLSPFYGWGDNSMWEWISTFNE